MALEMGLWRAEGGKLSRLAPSAVGLESELEDYIESEPGILGPWLMIIGRQVPTGYGGFIDLLAIDAEGVVHVLELKRDKTPREVVAQTLDYGSWVAGLGRDQVVDIFESYRPGLAFEEAFAEAFSAAPPDELNVKQILTIVAASLDQATERIVRFLSEGFDVPVNVVFFRHFVDGDAAYLARTWLITEEPQAAAASARRARNAREPWNGQDWYISFGEEAGGRVWEDAMKYGFVSAGGGDWFSRTLKSVPIGARVFACVPKRGYVGVGTVTREAQRFDQVELDVGGKAMAMRDLPLTGNYVHDTAVDTDETAEWVLPVEWMVTRPLTDAFWKAGMFANQNSACRLSQQFTIDEVETAFGLTD